MGSGGDRRVIVCPHGTRCSVRFTAERCEGGISVSIDDIGCGVCTAKIRGVDGGAAAEMRELIVRKITAAL